MMPILLPLMTSLPVAVVVPVSVVIFLAISVLVMVPSAHYSDLGQRISLVICCFPWWLRDSSGSFLMNTTPSESGSTLGGRSFILGAPEVGGTDLVWAAGVDDGGVEEIEEPGGIGGFRPPALFSLSTSCGIYSQQSPAMPVNRGSEVQKDPTKVKGASFLVVGSM